MLSSPKHRRQRDLFLARWVAPPSVLLSLLVTSGAAAQSYEGAWRSALEHASRGDHADAASVLEALAARFPDEYEVALGLGYQRFLAHDYEGAGRAYVDAARLSHGSFEARLGIAYSLLRLGRRERAAHCFRRALAMRDDPRAREGLALATARTWRAGLGLELGGASSPVLSRTLTGWAGARAWLTLESGLEVALGYLGSIADVGEQGYDQHQLHVAVGRRGRDGGFWLHYTAVTGTGGSWNAAHAFGASISWTGLGQLDVEAGATLWDSNDVVLRATLSWLFSLGDSVAVGPLLAAQWETVTRTGRGSAGAAIRFSLAPLSLLLYGYAGDERRPTYLTDGYVLTTAEPIRGGVGGRLAVVLGGGWSVPERVAHPPREGADPLADRDLRQDLVHQVRRHVRHPPSQARRAKSTAFAAECAHDVVPAPVARKVHQAMLEDAAPKVLLELPLHEPRQAAPLLVGLRDKARPVLAHELIE